MYVPRTLFIPPNPLFGDAASTSCSETQRKLLSLNRYFCETPATAKHCAAGSQTSRYSSKSLCFQSSGLIIASTQSDTAEQDISTSLSGTQTKGFHCSKEEEPTIPPRWHAGSPCFLQNTIPQVCTFCEDFYSQGSQQIIKYLLLPLHISVSSSSPRGHTSAWCSSKASHRGSQLPGHCEASLETPGPKKSLSGDSGRKGQPVNCRRWYRASAHPPGATGQDSLRKTQTNFANNFIWLFPNKFSQSY